MWVPRVYQGRKRDLAGSGEKFGKGRGRGGGRGRVTAQLVTDLLRRLAARE